MGYSEYEKKSKEKRKKLIHDVIRHCSTVEAIFLLLLVGSALGKLRPATAALLALRYSGLSYAEVATALGIPVDQVGTRLRRAQEAFRKEVLHGQER